MLLVGLGTLPLETLYTQRVANALLVTTLTLLTGAQLVAVRDQRVGQQMPTRL